MPLMFHKAWEWESRSLQLRSRSRMNTALVPGLLSRTRAEETPWPTPDCSRKRKLLDDRAKKAEFGNEESRHMKS
jgi:hypothetical protein